MEQARTATGSGQFITSWAPHARVVWRSSILVEVKGSRCRNCLALRATVIGRKSPSTIYGSAQSKVTCELLRQMISGTLTCRLDQRSTLVQTENLDSLCTVYKRHFSDTALTIGICASRKLHQWRQTLLRSYTNDSESLVDVNPKHPPLSYLPPREQHRVAKIYKRNARSLDARFSAESPPSSAGHVPRPQQDEDEYRSQNLSFDMWRLEDTENDRRKGDNREVRLRNLREQRWPPPNPRKVYPSNLKWATNPIYPRKNKPVHPEKNVSSLASRNTCHQSKPWVRDQDGQSSFQNSRKHETSTSSGSEEPEKETYLRRLLKARSLIPEPAKSYIQEPAVEEYEETSASQPSIRKTSVKPNAPAVSESIGSDEKALRQALKLRRQQTREVLREHFMEGSLSKTYSQLVVESMPGFVDHILIKAVALKAQERYVTSTFMARARACVAETKVAEIVKWMKHNHITVPRIGKLVDMKGQQLDCLRERISFLKENHVRGRDLGVVLTRQPVILDRPWEELRNVIQLLEDAGVRRDWVGFVICRSPGVLALSIDVLLDKISFFQDLGVTPEQFGPMVFNFPASIGHFPLPVMQTKVGYLRCLGLVDASIGRVIATRPQLLACDIETGWQRLVKYFKLLGIEAAGIQRILCVHPSVFCFNLEKNIAPKVRFLHAIGIRKDAIGQVIVDFPAILSYSLDKKIRPVVRFILEEAGVKEEHIGKVIALRPELIGTSLTLRLQPLVKYLRNQQLRREHLGIMVADFPMLLRYNLAVIEPKFRYLKRSMKRPLEDLISFPRYFSYSLEGRIKPRQHVLKASGLVFDLRYMLACNDEMFGQRVRAAVERYKIGEPTDELGEAHSADEWSVCNPTLAKALVENTSAVEGGSVENKDTVDFKGHTALVDNVSEIMKNAPDLEVSMGQICEALIPDDNSSHNAIRIGSSLEVEDEWTPEEVESTNEDKIGDEEIEGSDQERDEQLGIEDVEFFMKYCV